MVTNNEVIVRSTLIWFSRYIHSKIQNFNLYLDHTSLICRTPCTLK